MKKTFKNSFKLGLIATSIALLSACGGGDDKEINNLAGTYNYSDFKLTANTCNSDVAQTIDRGIDSVTQDEANITLNSFGTIFRGTVDADNMGFTASYTQTQNDVPVVSKYAFRRIVIGKDYAVNFSTTTGACTVQYSGTALRS
jgi:predicted porin